MTKEKREEMEEALKNVILPVQVPKEEYDRVINYLITTGFFKQWLNN